MNINESTHTLGGFSERCAAADAKTMDAFLKASDIRIWNTKGLFSR